MNLKHKARFAPLLLLGSMLALHAQPRSVQEAQAQTAVCGPMDVAFVIDDTGSMGAAIDNVKSELAGILGSIATASGNDYRLALVTFKDNITVRDVFAANNSATVSPDILGLAAGGGAGEPEASNEALNTVVNALPAAGRPQNVDFTPAYRPTALKIAVLVTDARPGGFDDTYTSGVDNVNAHAVALAAAVKGIKVSAVQVPSSQDPTVTPIMMDYAATTGGKYVLTAPDGSGTGAAIRDIINNCGSGTGADLTITKDPKPGQPAATPGGLYSYIIRVKNTGNKPTPAPPISVMLRDDLTNVGTFNMWTANSGICSNNAPFVDCSRGRMAPGEEWWVEIRVRLANRACGITNTAVVDWLNRIPELNENNNSASLTTYFGVDRCIDTDGTATGGDGFANPLTPGSVQVALGKPLHAWPTGGGSEGIDMFDNDNDGQWTFGLNGDDLHSEDGPGAIRNGVHDHPNDPHILDYNGSLNVSGQPVSCDFEVGAFCPATLPGMVKFYDANGNGFWDDGEDIVLDTNNDGIFN